MTKTSNKILFITLQNLPIVLFILIFIGFGTLSHDFFQLDKLRNIVKSSSYIGIVAVGMTFVLLTAGIDISVGSNMYLSTAVAGMLIQNYNLPLGAGLVICLSVGALFGMVNAYAIVQLKILPFVTTLGTLVAGRALGKLITGSEAIAYPDSMLKLSTVQAFNFVPISIIIFAVVVLLAYIFLNQTKTGRQIYAVGNNPEASIKAGINNELILILTYVICGVMAALGGFISVMQSGGEVTPGFGKEKEFDAIAAAVLGGASLFGGIGNVFPGTVLGTLMLQMITAGLVTIQAELYHQPIITACIIFLAVFLDSTRITILQKMGRRNIRVEPG